MKIVIEMSLAKYINSGLCGRNATEWGKCFNNNELDQLENIFEELQENGIIDESIIDSYFDEDPAMLANWIGKWDSEFFGDNVRWVLNNFSGDYEIEPEDIDPSDGETMYYDSIESDLEHIDSDIDFEDYFDFARYGEDCQINEDWQYYDGSFWKFWN